jgi:CheY-like chemotaxis protein
MMRTKETNKNSMKQKKKILIVEDNPADEFFTRKALEDLPLNLESTSDGEETINRLTSSLSEDLPDIILLDLNLPKIHGLSVLKYIKEHPGLENIVVIVVSSTQDPTEINKLEKYKADGFVHKSLDFTIFKREIISKVMYT